MSHSNPPASFTSAPDTPDTRTVVALLEGLLPLLIRMQQSQTFGPPPLQLEPGNLMIHNAMLDHQAAVSLVEDMTAESLRILSGYLERHAGEFAELQGCVGVVTQAAYCFAVRDYGQAFALIFQAYRLIIALRAANPQLPPLRALSQGNAAPSPPTTSVH
jgi:hypothetical protein